MRLWIVLSLLASLAPVQVPAAPAKVEASPARSTFERFARMAGHWSAASTKGWTEELSFQLIAGGSTVVETSFNAHPDETMTTMFHMDGDRLLLTHYCVAKNQPRLAATKFEDNGRTVTFTFVDATNLPTRDHGHMDKVMYKFIDEDHVTSQWTWFQGGKEQWMEEVTSTRKRDARR